jgi:peptidoglycan/xylan/chitin deacetylase (PgdA/CDA1 family)
MSASSRIARGVGRVLRTHYPPFLFGFPLRHNEIPIFTYHDVDPAVLTRDLQFLRANGYRTLSLEEFLGTGRKSLGRSVLLTFDDARRSFWQVALPLLRELGARAVLFAPSYWMTDPASRGAGTDLFMSWKQLRACVDSGLVDVQSHAHRHALVFANDRLADFANPSALARYDIYDWPMRYVDGTDELGPPVLGTPVYHATPLLSARRRYLENGELASACRQFVQACGGQDFFRDSGWSARLRAFHAAKSASMDGRFMPAEELLALLASEFERSREEFRTHLGYAPTSLAYPWMLGSKLSLELAKRAGIQAAFGVALDYRAGRDRTLPMPVFGRLKSDWLRLLPGKGRSSMLSTIGRKISEFAQVQNLAH